ncbi:MAG: hypothetical protein NT040_11065 [Bacteroidetes bacterium]|nr:hypothetical protein [Bacteroidota bacterium]
MTELPEDLELLPTDAGAKESVITSAEVKLETAGDNIILKGDAINEICVELNELNNGPQSDLIISYLSKKYKVSKKTFNDNCKKLLDASRRPKFDRGPKLMTDYDEDEETDPTKKQGWFIRNNCYWFHSKEGMPVKGSNFIITPLFHIYSKTDNKRLVRITNDEGFSKIIDIPSQKFISVEMFQAYVYGEGNFIWSGGKPHFMKILQHISKSFPVCNELKTLGWQREGFYAFANGIYNGTWQPVDDFGITTHKGENYFSPAFSSVYKGVREDDDEYENDRYFVYNLSPVTFKEWSTLMTDVYGKNAVIAVSYAIASIFRDLIYEKYKIFPHLFLFGEKQSGKSQLAWSLSNLFFHNLPAFNLNSGTHVGLSRKGSRVKNCIVWTDEYSNDIDPRRFQLLKAAYDGVGHEKGKMTQDSRTSVTKINAAFCISGQYLPTIDDNSLLTRSCLLSFIKKQYSDWEMQRYDELKKIEVEGISSLVCKILDYRPRMEAHFAVTFSEIQEKLKSEMIHEKLQFDERLVRNYSCLLAPIKILTTGDDPLELSFTYETMWAQVKHDIAQLSKQIASSESISGFWKMVEFLLDEGKIQNNVDFLIKSVPSLSVTNKDGDDEHKKFNPPEKCLFIRFSRVHPLYMEKHRQQTGKNGVDLVSILHYLKNHKSYVGNASAVRFDTSNTSAFVFKYGPNELNINLERTIRDVFSNAKSGSEPPVPEGPPPDLFDDGSGIPL